MLDYTIWDSRRAFTAKEAAHLWCEIDPNAKEISGDTELKIKAMEGVIDELHHSPFYICFEDDPFGPDKFTREELKAYAEERKERPPFLFPKERKSRDEQRDINKHPKVTGFKHSVDFRSVNKDGKIFSLTPKQAQAIQMLFKAQQENTPDLGQDRIVDDVCPGTDTKRLRDIFKSSSEAWKELIERGDRKGTFRLKI